MNFAISGLGWVTPFGTDLETVYQRLRSGEIAEPKPILNPESGRPLSLIQVPPKSVESLGRNPRLRRSSPISYFAVAAGLAALEDAGLALTPELAARTAIVFGITDGGVQYTRRFYEQIAKQGANAASPMLFPETVYNAPASHLAAQLGITGASYTLVGDGAVGLGAIDFAGQLLETLDLDHCVVVCAEESDWVLSQAYGDWRMSGVPLAEGAAALVLSRQGRWNIQTHPGAPFFRRSEAQKALASVFAHLGGAPDLVIRSANGGWLDKIEAASLAQSFLPLRALAPKLQLGEATAASSLIQTVLGALAMEHGEAQRVLISVLGLNQHANAALLSQPG